MEEAAKLLKVTPQLKILVVSERVGYVSAKHFSCIFKSYFNITPGDYQENYFKKGN
jgi:two-component system response regulator YesN